jgi:hypothetical protein
MIGKNNIHLRRNDEHIYAHYDERVNKISNREFNSEVRHPPTQLGGIPRTPCRAA